MTPSLTPNEDAARAVVFPQRALDAMSERGEIGTIARIAVAFSKTHLLAVAQERDRCTPMAHILEAHVVAIGSLLATLAFNTAPPGMAMQYVDAFILAARHAASDKLAEGMDYSVPVSDVAQA